VPEKQDFRRGRRNADLAVKWKIRPTRVFPALTPRPEIVPPPLGRRKAIKRRSGLFHSFRKFAYSWVEDFDKTNARTPEIGAIPRKFVGGNLFQKKTPKRVRRQMGVAPRFTRRMEDL